MIYVSNIFIYKPDIKTFIHVYKVVMIINNTNINWGSETMTNRCRGSRQIYVIVIMLNIWHMYLFGGGGGCYK